MVVVNVRIFLFLMQECELKFEYEYECEWGKNEYGEWNEIKWDRDYNLI